MRKNKRKSWLLRLMILTTLMTGGISTIGCSWAQPKTAEDLLMETGEALVREVSGPSQEEGKDTGVISVTGPAEEVIEDNYLGGAELRLLDCADGGQNLSCVIRTANGGVIVVDGGRDVDDEHLTKVIRSMGGRVNAWLITHPHSDHIGALTNILNTDPLPIEIDQIYYSFLTKEYTEQGEHQGRISEMLNLLDAFQKMDAGKLNSSIKKGDQIQVDDVTITVMNEPFACLENTVNNSSVAYRLEVNGKRILFLGDMGWQAGENFLKVCTPEELKADVVQMSHHGQDGVEQDVYAAIAPEICLWPTPQWLWDNELDGVADAGPYKTRIVRGWMEELGVKHHLSIKDGDRILK